jgi:phosphate transport system substrate-binding protein
MKLFLVFGLFLSLFYTSAAQAEPPREIVRIVGSASVYPFMTVVAEKFGRTHYGAVPIVESTGTGGGLKLFCSNNHQDVPALVTASRPIRPSETELCTQRGVETITEIVLGYDALLFVRSSAVLPGRAETFALSQEDIYKAMAKTILSEGQWIANPYHNWRDIHPSLPDMPILIYGPPLASGTRDALIEIVLEPACEAQRKALPETIDAPTGVCRMIREDGRFVEGSNDNVIIQKLMHNHEALGIVAFGYFMTNQASLEASPINHVAPTPQTILAGKYPVSRPLFVYAKDVSPTMPESLRLFLRDLVSEDALGKEGYLAGIGLIPLPAKQIEKQKQHISDLLKKP